MRPLPSYTTASLAFAGALAIACSTSSGPPAAAEDGGNQGAEAGSDAGVGSNGDATGGAEASTEAGAADAGGERTTTTCTSDADCAGGICGFPTAGGCTVTGTCFPAPGATCLAYGPGCACDGTTVNVVCNGLPLGYAPKPLLHSGDCTSDAGPG